MYRWTLGSEDGGWRKEVPFHCTTNSTHHARSALKPWANLIGTLLLGGRYTAWSKSIIRLRKGRPGLTTLVEKADERFQLLPCAVLPCLPFCQQASQPGQFVLWKSQLSLDCVDDNAQEGYLRGWALRFMVSNGDSQPSALIQQDLQLSLAYPGVWGSYQDVIIQVVKPLHARLALVFLRGSARVQAQ